MSVTLNRALALAIGWTPDRVATMHSQQFGDYVEVGGKIFHYLDPQVIWPIAAAFDCFPAREAEYDDDLLDMDAPYSGPWFSDRWMGQERGNVRFYGKSAAHAVAVAVIGR